MPLLCDLTMFQLHNSVGRACSQVLAFTTSVPWSHGPLERDTGGQGEDPGNEVVLSKIVDPI